MTKPSEWTPQEAWSAAVARCRESARVVYGTNMNERMAWVAMAEPPFPADPVERVSDDALVAIETFGTPTPEHAKSMAIEIRERRKAEKEGKG